MAKEAFEKWKRAITDALVLSLLDFSQSFTLKTDVSLTGVVVVLGQNGPPIAYLSKKLSPRRHKQLAYIREMVQITEEVAKFHHYLIGLVATPHHYLLEITEELVEIT